MCEPVLACYRLHALEVKEESTLTGELYNGMDGIYNRMGAFIFCNIRLYETSVSEAR